MFGVPHNPSSAILIIWIRKKEINFTANYNSKVVIIGRLFTEKAKKSDPSLSN